jgi:putative heme-binding domain-containing protein
LAIDTNNLSVSRLQPLLNRTSRDKTIPTGIGAALVSLAGDATADDGRKIDPKKLDVLARIAGAWQVEPLVPVLVKAMDDAESPSRQQLIGSLGSFNTPEVTRKLDQLTRDPDVGTRVAATRAIAARRPLAAIDSLVQLLQDEASADAGAAILVSLLNRKGTPQRMAEAIEQRELPADLARSLLRGVRSSGGNAELEQALRIAGKLEKAAWQFTPQLRDEILAAAASQGAAARGEAIYRREKLQCIECHAIGNAGGLVGPNLISVGGSSQPDYILESLLDPNAKLKEGFTTLTVLTDEGEILNGIVLGRNDQFVRLRLADGKEVQVDSEAIEQEKPGKSLMPEGLLDSLTKSELVDLLAFLSALGRDPAFTVSTDPIVRSLDTLVYSDEANRRLNRTSTDTVATDDPAMNWRPLTSKVDGTIPLSELDTFKQHRETPPTSFLRFQVEMPADGVAKIEFPDIEFIGKGMEAWVDSKPTPVWDLASQAFSAGRHQIVLAIDREQCTTPFAIRVSGDAK